MSLFALIVAAGRGSRFGASADVPKQYHPLMGAPVLRHSIEAFLRADFVDHIRVVIHTDDAPLYAKAIEGLADARLLPPVLGADTRAGSVKAGLEACGDATWVMIHDAARPLVSRHDLAALYAAMQRHGAAFLAEPVVDSLWRADQKGEGLSPVSREGLFAAQTPQGFRLSEILAGHRAPGAAEASDDVALALKAGLTPAPVIAQDENFKLTYARDLARAARIMEARSMAPETILPDIRTGHGFDVHAFCAGTSLTLCGVSIAHEKALLGHSDADVGMHALTDALYGALAEGDIGQWFPPSDPQWKGAASDIFLAHAADLARRRGFTITHMDVTLICERPKIGPHADAMRAALARISGVDQARISVKATTSERLGFTGREEGIAAMATATLVRLGAG